MTPSKENPDYSIVLTTLEKEQFEITPIVLSLDMSHQKEQLAQSATLTLVNINYNGRWANTIFKPRQRVFIYANDGERHEEVFRGFVWSVSYTSSTKDRELILRCYDNLIYLQESEESAFYAAGWSTKDILADLFKRWSIPLQYNYTGGITHSQLALRGVMSDLILSDVLDTARKQSGKKYAVVMQKDTVVIRTVGDNETYYRIADISNAIHTKTGSTMEGMVTKVVILGKSDDKGKSPVEATVTGDTATYGTLQKLQDRNEDTNLTDAKKEAQAVIDEKGLPKDEYELKCSDIPWVRRGDRVFVDVGSIYQKMLVVVGIDRSISDNSKDMTLTMEEPT